MKESQQDPFYDLGLFPFAQALIDGWRVIRAELDALDGDGFIDWPEHSLYGERGWDTFGLFAFGQRQPDGCARCPRTERLLRGVPGLMTAGFSRLQPGARIAPHCGYEGYAGYVLRLHLGLDVPDECAIRVGSTVKSWREGECFVFDDSIEHEAWNKSNRARTVLLCDFVNPLRRKPLVLNPKFTPELIRYLEEKHLPTQNLVQRLVWYVWKLANPSLVREAFANVAQDRYV